MYLNLFKILVLCVSITSTKQVSTINSPYYTASVIEFARSNTNITQNLEEYINIINSLETDESDIVVFPESALSYDDYYVPDPKYLITPCDNMNYSIFLRKISCEAKKTKKYIVINLTEKMNCTTETQEELNDTRPCANNKLYRFNTNLVFDRNGAVISRYRKFNLFGELGINQTVKPDISLFTTDFGVTFGMFTCFDLLFKTPSLDLIKYGATDIIFPTWWFSELPFYTSIQIQQSWAYKYDVNMLAANGNAPVKGSSGSGIYAGRIGQIISNISYKNVTAILTAHVPKKNFISSSGTIMRPRLFSKYQHNPKNMLDYIIKCDDSVSYFITKELDLNFLYNEDTLCFNELCCDFNIKYSIKEKTLVEKSYKYRMAVFNGVRHYDGFVTGGTAICGILACTNNTQESCGLRFNKNDDVVDEIVFENILISGKFKGGDNISILPNAVTSNLYPLESYEFSYIEGLDYEQNGKTWRKISLQLFTPQSNLLSFAIHGRNFETDGQPITTKANNGNKMKINLTKIAIFFASAYFINKI